MANAKNHDYHILPPLDLAVLWRGLGICHAVWRGAVDAR